MGSVVGKTKGSRDGLPYLRIGGLQSDGCGGAGFQFGQALGQQGLKLDQCG